MKLISTFKNSALLQKQFYRLIASATKTVNNKLDFCCSQKESSYRPPGEDFFQTEDGKEYPIYKDYRYSIKPGWKYFSSLNALSRLFQLKLISDENKLFFKEAIGTRTLGHSLNDIEEVCKKTISNNRHHFLSDSLDKPYNPVLLPGIREIKQLIRSNINQHKILFSKLLNFGVKIPKPEESKLLEIGYLSGGYSLFAFEKLGFKAYGLDNFYGDESRKFTLPQHIKNVLSSDVEFCIGDITQTTDFKPGQFDIIYSGNVLEHVSSLSNTLKEMYRILKPEGLMIHIYNPFFCPNGGHALGILDFPWGHVRLCKEDYLRYIDELRPFESEVAKEWINNSLNAFSIQQLQQELALNGFKVLFWQQHAAPRHQQDDLSVDVMRDCFTNYPNIGLNDLISSSITFAACKVADRG